MVNMWCDVSPIWTHTWLACGPMLKICELHHNYLFDIFCHMWPTLWATFDSLSANCQETFDPTGSLPNMFASTNIAMVSVKSSSVSVFLFVVWCICSNHLYWRCYCSNASVMTLLLKVVITISLSSWKYTHRAIPFSTNFLLEKCYNSSSQCS